MKNFAFRLILKCAAVVIVCGPSACALAGAETNTASRVTAPALVRSVFVDDPRSGKDPFFPGSKRRLEVAEQTSLTNVARQPSALFEKLTLKGISGLKGQRLALINSSTVAVGEQADIRCGLQFVKILIREIRDRSVLVELVAGGEVRELKLREGI